MALTPDSIKASVLAIGDTGSPGLLRGKEQFTLLLLSRVNTITTLTFYLLLHLRKEVLYFTE